MKCQVNVLHQSIVPTNYRFNLLILLSFHSVFRNLYLFFHFKIIFDWNHVFLLFIKLCLVQVYVLEMHLFQVFNLFVLKKLFLLKPIKFDFLNSKFALHSFNFTVQQDKIYFLNRLAHVLFFHDFLDLLFFLLTYVLLSFTKILSMFLFP